ncbi:MAG: lactate utilization protein B [Planctomycetia bacterium]|nr:lactate utilization protein B [Planctomycetia bacterium]
METKTSFEGARFLKEETRGLSEPTGSLSLAIVSEKSSDMALDNCWKIPEWPDWRQTAHDVKAWTIAHLDSLLIQFTEQLEKKGVTVLWAKDAAEANQHVLNIAKEHEVKTVVKGKSMVSEEIGLNHALAANKITPLETDLGEYIVQMTGKRPTHIVIPATHLSADDIGQLFHRRLGVPYTAKHEELTMIARRILREKFVQADMGISGVNFGIAETGNLCLVENEGNIGLSTTLPKVHVALMGIEKLIPKLDYLPLFLNMLPRMATNQKLTSYTHLFCGPTQGRKMYLILIDNGRTKVLAQKEHRKTLHCIRCGVCMAHCPVYRHVGGWAYGWVYPGPLGSVITPLMLGVETAGKLPFACSLCGACSQICPVQVDLAHQMIRLRDKAIKNPSPVHSRLDRLMWKIFAVAMQSKTSYEWLMFGVRMGTRIAPWLPVHPWLLGRWTRGRGDWIPGRAIPKPKSYGTFRSWWKYYHPDNE